MFIGKKGERMDEKEYYFESDLPREIYDEKLPMFTKDDFVQETDELKMSNPFLYNFKECKNVVYSIEEFGLVYKKRKIFIGSIVRNEEIPNYRKKKILSKYLRKCKKEFVSRYRLTKKRIIKTNSKELNNKIGLSNKIVLFVLLLINCIILGLMNGKINEILGIEYSNEFVLNIENVLKNDIITMILNLSLYLIIFAILHVNLYSKIINNYNYDYKNHIDNSLKTLNNIYDIFKKEYSKVKKHYIMKINSSVIYCPTIYLDNLWNLNVTFNDVIHSKEFIENKNINVNRFNRINKYILKSMFVLIILSNAFTVGLFIFVLLKSIINKI